MDVYNSGIALMEQMDDIVKKMRERRKQLQNIQLYELLAKEDAEMKELLDTLKGLNACGQL